MKGKIYLIPNHLGPDPVSAFFLINTSVLENINFLVVENGKEARKFLKSLKLKKPLSSFNYLELNKHDSNDGIEEFISPAMEGQDIGVISDAGCPGIADPGSELVAQAHKKGIQVIPLIGPSSITLSLMASGMNGQSFAFHGYLPIDNKERVRKIKELESRSTQFRETQLFIETPYRNEKLFDTLLKTCNPSTSLCIACNLTLEEEYIKTMSINSWKKVKVDLNKKPAIFLLQSPSIF